MAGNKERIVYWDSCIFISWLNEEKPPQRLQTDVDGLREQLDQFNAKRLHVATSIITITEVLEAHVAADKRERMLRLASKTNFHYQDVTRPVAMLSHEIRDFYQHQKVVDNLPTLTTPDAIHLASAMLNDCEVFYTYDATDKESGSRAKRALIPLSGKVLGKPSLRIERPYAVPPPPSAQVALFDAVETGSGQIASKTNENRE